MALVGLQAVPEFSLLHSEVTSHPMATADFFGRDKAVRE
jgi:hypothetical protein